MSSPTRRGRMPSGALPAHQCGLTAPRAMAERRRAMRERPPPDDFPVAVAVAGGWVRRRVAANGGGVGA
ncbi:hypothetical protein [Streptomyces djakartensis]|uniref:hypothetical protein n=1 Tax=Streptomyces djakartensis TaxID=68193 RepID=UPI0034DFCB3D